MCYGEGRALLKRKQTIYILKYFQIGVNGEMKFILGIRNIIDSHGPSHSHKNTVDLPRERGFYNHNSIRISQALYNIT